MLVMDETRLFNSAPEYLKQLEWLVRRDRNHPSVILWSLFNEEGLEVNEEGMEITRTMNAVVKRFDQTRPTTGAQNKGQLGGDGKANPKNAAWTMDVVGINYQAGEYDKILAAYPDKPAVSTEDTSQVMTRGAYATDYSKFIVGSYDDVYPGWDRHSSARNSWEAIATRPRLAGSFSWTGFDYRGEPTPFGWPSASSFFGALDLCGFPKTEFYFRQAHWVKTKPVLTLVPHWNWPGKEGQPIRVMAACNADRVALSLNGKLIEEKPVHPFQMVEWQVPYAPGRLEAVAKKDGKEVARYAVETTGEPVAIRLTRDPANVSWTAPAERSGDGALAADEKRRGASLPAAVQNLNADGVDVAIFTVSAVDAEGRDVPLAQHKVNFTIEGAGKIIGVGNGDPNCHDPEVFLPPAPCSVSVNGWRWKLAEVPAGRSVLPEYANDFDDSAWKELKPSDGNTINKEHTTAIYRAHLTLTEDDLKNAELRLRFAGCDDDGWFFVNNQFVGESHDWAAQPVFNAKQFLRVGDNVIAVGVKNSWGGGGLKPEVNLDLVGEATTLTWSRRLFNGLAQVIVQSVPVAGEIKLTATTAGLAPATVVLQAKPCAPRPSVP
jgi:beta-galactosidase